MTTKIDNLHRAYLAFLTEGVVNAWIEGDGIALFVRKGTRLTNEGRRFTTIEVGNISGGNDVQMVAILKMLEQHNPRDGIWLEQTHLYGGSWAFVVSRQPWLTRVKVVRPDDDDYGTYYAITRSDQREPAHD